MVIELLPGDVAALALEVTLLVSGMASVLMLRSARGQLVSLALDSGEKRAAVERLAPSHFKFQLGTNQAEYLQAVLLRAYRDEVAEVSHIHIEGHEGDSALDLTLLFQVYRAPMSPDEAAQLLE